MARVLAPRALSSAALADRDPSAQVASLDGLTMGTSWSVKLVSSGRAWLAAVDAMIRGRLDQVVAEMSHRESDSHLSRFNRAVAGEWRDLQPGFYKVLGCALEVAELSGGAYDPTIGPLVDLWGFGPAPARHRPPDEAGITGALARTGWQRITLDPGRRAARQPGGSALDFSAIAKGFAVDLIADGLRRLGINHFLVEVGGELRGEGAKPDGSPWWVAIERPPAADASGWTETLVALHGLAVATSGDYRRWFDWEGKRYSHSIDPRTGWPVANGVVSTTVLHPSCMKADVFATALTVLGPEAGMAFAVRHELAALFVTQGDTGPSEAMSPAFAAMLD